MLVRARAAMFLRYLLIRGKPILSSTLRFPSSTKTSRTDNITINSRRRALKIESRLPNYQVALCRSTYKIAASQVVIRSRSSGTSGRSTEQ